MQVWNMLYTARWKYRTQKLAKNRHLGTIAQFCRTLSSQLRHVSTIGKKNLLSSNIFFTYPHNMVNFGLLAAEIISLVWGTPANSTGFASRQRYCTTLEYWASAKLCGDEQRAPPMFGRSAITLGINPHSSWWLFSWQIPAEHLEGLYTWNDEDTAPVQTVFAAGSGLVNTDYVIYIQSAYTSACLQGVSTRFMCVFSSGIGRWSDVMPLPYLLNS